MEVIGTVAATAQLLGMVMKILESISQLHELVKHVPGRYHSWDTELTILGEMIYCIQCNSALQTFQVGQVIANISPKIESLVLLCREHAPRSEAKRLKRVLTTLSACAVEPRILQRFESLEHDKTTLLLAINLCIVSSPLAIEDMPKRGYEEIRQGSTGNPSDAHGSSSLRKTLVLVQKKDHKTYAPERCDAHAPGNWDYRHNASSAHQYEAEEFVAPQQGFSRRSSYTAVKVVGNSIIVGTSRGEGADFNDINLEGDRQILGDHERGVIGDLFKSKAHASQQRWARGRRPRRGVSPSESSMKGAAKGDPTGVAFRGKGVNKNFNGRME